MKIHFLIEPQFQRIHTHLGHQVAAPHFKVYICGYRNGIAIIDSDKTLLSLRNALHFLGNLIRTKKARFFLLNTNNFFIYEIMVEMAGSIQDSQWQIGAFLNSCSSKKNLRSRTNKISLGFHRSAPDCVLILDAEIQSSVIIEAYRAQIPIVSFIYSNTPLKYSQKITYPIPAKKDIQFLYLFCSLLRKESRLPKVPQLSSRSFSTKRKGEGKQGFVPLWAQLLLVIFAFVLLGCALWRFCTEVEVLLESTLDLLGSLGLFLGRLADEVREVLTGQREEPMPMGGTPSPMSGNPSEDIGAQLAKPLLMERGEQEGGRRRGLDVDLNEPSPEELEELRVRKTLKENIHTIMSPLWKGVKDAEKNKIFQETGPKRYISYMHAPTTKRALTAYIEEKSAEWENPQLRAFEESVFKMGSSSPFWKEFLEKLPDLIKEKPDGDS